MSSDPVEHEYARYFPDGAVEVAIVPRGPQLWYSGRAEQREFMRRGFVLRGYYIISERLSRGPFAPKGVQDTVKFVVRPCKTAAEAQAVLETIKITLPLESAS